MLLCISLLQNNFMLEIILCSSTLNNAVSETFEDCDKSLFLLLDFEV